MNLLSDREFWEFVGLLIGVVATALVVVGKFNAFGERILGIYRARKRRKQIRGLLLEPSIEELALYGAKLPQWLEPEEIEETNRNKLWLRGAEFRELQRAEGRLLILGIIFSALFGYLALKYIELVIWG